MRVGIVVGILRVDAGFGVEVLVEVHVGYFVRRDLFFLQFVFFVCFGDGVLVAVVSVASRVALDWSLGVVVLCLDDLVGDFQVAFLVDDRLVD